MSRWRGFVVSVYYHLIKLVVAFVAAIKLLYNLVKKYIAPLVIRSFAIVVFVTNRVIDKTWKPLRKKLVADNKLFSKWDEWKYRPYFRNSVTVLVVAMFVFSIFRSSLMAAPDLNDTWNFSNPADYSLGSGVEIASGIARLKAQNYTDDANTSALYHFDESGGSNITDSSSNSNDGTLSGGSFVAGNLNNAASFNGTSSKVSVPDSPALSLSQNNTIEGWTKFNSSFSTGTHEQRQAIVDKGDYQLYYDNETGKLTYELANSSTNSWTKAAGDDVNGSWGLNGKTAVFSSVTVGSELYAGTGINTKDAEVYKWNGTIWSKVGGDGVNSSWSGEHEYVLSLETDGTNVYAGLGSGAGDAEVWRWDGSSWSKIGGDSSAPGQWGIGTHEGVYSLDYYGGNLYAGLGASANDAEVWRWNGSSWTKIGGDSLNLGWTTNYEYVYSMTNDGSNLYVGLGITANDAEVWRWNGSSWTKVADNGSGFAANYEMVRSLYYDGTYVYAGTGDTAGDGDIYRCSGCGGGSPTWTQIGGDGLNLSWAGGTYEYVHAITGDGTTIYVGLGNSNGEGEVFSWDGSSWTKIGGDGINSSWSTNDGDAVFTLAGNGSTIYTGTYDAGGTGQMWTWNGSSWTRIGGNYINNSWGYYNLQSVEVMQWVGDYLYAGSGYSVAGNALIWRYDGNNWELIGGQGVKNSWDSLTYESITSMASMGGNLYVGLGTSANDAEVWMWDGSTWTKIGGDNINNGWNTNFDMVASLGIYNGEVYAGVGISGTEAEVWKWDGTNWSKVGGDGVNSSWNTSYETVRTMTNFGNKLAVGIGDSTGDAEVWTFDGTTWQLIGGGPSSTNNSWGAGAYEYIHSMSVYNGKLYAGLGFTAGDGELWEFDGTNWSQIGGDTLNNGWDGNVEAVRSMSPYKGRLYVGNGNSGNTEDNSVWSWGNNGFVQSSTSSFDTNWHHVAATYNGSTMKLYVDGTEVGSNNISLSMPDSSRELYLGSSWGGREQGKPRGYFQGLLDEIRISNVVRSSFTTKPYLDSPQTIQLANAVRKFGVWHWDTLSHTDIPNGGSINYRLSDNNGATWKYWDGLAWSVSNDLSESNTVTVITNNFDTFPITFNGLIWQAVLDGDGTQQVSIDGVSAEATSDTIDPTANPTNIIGYKANGGSVLNSGDWTNGSSPYFTWDPGTDADVGVYGYCAYLGTDSNADPVTTKGILGTSPATTGDNCQFVVQGNSLDLATPGVVGTPLSSSNDIVYLNLRTIDKAGNVTGSSAQFSFRFDNTAPNNPGFITAPSGFINTKDVEMSWPTTGGSAPSDTNSGLAGLQYRIGSGGTWYGDSHTGTGDMSDLLNNDGLYATIPTPDHNDLTEGINTIYFRTWDQAGNYTTTYVTATLKINTSGAPSEPTNLSASPSINTINSFGFNWDAPVTYVGDVNNITYCYTVNTLPSASSCVYTATGSTELTLGAYATQPGSNTMYVVARDESSNINYSNYASINFTANTSAPGMPLNTDIVDVSIKNTNNWRLALTWDPPSYVGSGVSSYRIYRSTDNVTFTQVGSSSSTTYIDASLSQQTYYYNVTACDNTNNCGAAGTTVNAYPTGKFTSPAILISGPTVSDITTKKAKIIWATDRNSDSKIAIGTQSGHYSSSEVGNSDQVSSHEINIDNLSPGTTYYFKTKWTDEDGNTGTSQEQTFTTAPAPSIKEVTVDSINLSNASVSFTTKGATKTNIYYGASESFGGVKEINTSTEESRYQVNLDNLSDGTKYYFMISTFDQEGAEYKGNIMTFNTPARPRITNLRFQPVSGEPTSTQRITWDTNVPSHSQVTYSTSNGSPKDIQDSKLVTNHELVIQNLQDDSVYTLVASSRDIAGNVATSDRQTFRTSLDTRPPKISNIVTESSIRGSGSEARGQIVVSWRTDEPSASQVAYSEGSGVTIFNSKTAEDTRLTTEHIVIISDLPTSRVYSIQPLSNDVAHNEGTGEIQTTIIGRASDSAITVIFNSLKAIFGL